MMIKIFGYGFLACMIVAIICMSIDFHFVTRIRFSEIALGVIYVALGCEIGFIICAIIEVAKVLLKALGVI